MNDLQMEEEMQILAGGTVNQAGEAVAAHQTPGQGAPGGREPGRGRGEGVPAGGQGAPGGRLKVSSHYSLAHRE